MDFDSYEFKNNYWRCRWCGAPISKKGEKGKDYVEYPSKWYYCPECYEQKNDLKNLKEIDTGNPEYDESYKFTDAMYRYIFQKFGVKFDFARVQAQLVRMYKKHKAEGWTYANMYKALVYFYEVRHGNWKKSNGGIGIVEFVYQDCLDYYAREEAKREAINNSIRKDEPKTKVIVIPRIEKERKKEVYNIEEW